MTMRMAFAFAGLALLGGCTTGMGPTPRQEANRAALENAREVGEPEDCVTLSSVRETRVLDDGAIDFHLANGQVLRNRLPHSCPGLAFDDSFSYRSTLGRLCSIDTITVRGSGGNPGPTCGLGPFHPVEIGSR